MSKRRFLLKPRFIIIVTLSLALILIVSAVVELVQVRREIYHVLSEEATSLIESVAISSDNATLAYSELEHQVAERLLSNARMVAALDTVSGLTQQSLTTLAQKNDLYRINVFDEQGNKVLTSHVYDTAHDSFTASHHPREFIAPILDGSRKELVIGFKESRYDIGQRFAVAVGRAGGGAIVVNIDADEMLRLRRAIGVGRILNDLAAKAGIHYAVIQDTSGILAASKNISTLTRITSEPFLNDAFMNQASETRLTEWNDMQIFEAVAPFIIDGEKKGLIRMGLRTDHIQEANARMLRRLGVISLILLVGGVLVFNFIIIHQNYTVLDEAYLRAQTYTGNILANMTDAVVALDGSGKITLFNQAAETIFGVSEQEALGKACSELIKGKSILEQTLQTGEAVTEREAEYILGGRQVVLSISTFIVKNKSGETDLAVAVIRDLTEKRAMERNLRQKEKLTAMGELASGVAHEVRNPLNAIGMIAQRLNNEFEPKADVQEYRTLSKTIVTEVRRLNDIIQRFLKFARPSKLHLRKVDMHALLKEVIELIQPEVTSKGGNIVQQFGNLSFAVIDPDQMKQVFLNLLQNSAQVIQQGGDIQVSTWQDADRFYIEIQDTGPGISADHLDKIFDLYFTTKDSGTGMGLSIAHQIVAAHGGSIKVESRSGEGTVFTVALPQSEKTAPTIPSGRETTTELMES